MAGVYLGEEARLARKVAIKVMAPSLMVDPRMVDRFRQEARSTARLSHPHIITIHEIDEKEGLHYFVMSFVEGPTLDQVMKEATEPLPVSQVRRWLLQIAGALQHAHRAGVVHRDVKPGNVLVDPEGNAVVTDFGIAKVADEPGLTRTGMLVGTPSYMSPEQCMEGEVTGAADQYALGALAYHLLGGRPPFTGTAMAVLQAHLSETPAPIQELRPDCPQPLAGLVHRMLAKDPAERWPSMAEVVTALEGAGETAITHFESVPAPPPIRAPEGSRTQPERRRKRPAGLVVAGLGIPLLALALFVLLRGGGPEEEEVTGVVEAGPSQVRDLVPPAAPEEDRDPATGADAQEGEPVEEPEVEPPPATPPVDTRPEPAPAPIREEAPPPVPLPVQARVEVAGSLPPGARLLARGETGTVALDPGGGVELPPGSYTLEATAEGFQGDRRQVTLAAGERLQWTPVLAPVEAAVPAAFDEAAAQFAVENSLSSLASAFRARNMDQVLRIYPSAPEEWRERWGAVVENTEQIRDLQVEVLEVGHRTTTPERAEVAFTLGLSFVDFRNRANQQRHPFLASLLPEAGGWILTELRSAP